MNTHSLKDISLGDNWHEEYLKKMVEQMERSLRSEKMSANNSSKLIELKPAKFKQLIFMNESFDIRVKSLEQRSEEVRINVEIKAPDNQIFEVRDVIYLYQIQEVGGIEQAISIIYKNLCKQIIANMTSWCREKRKQTLTAELIKQLSELEFTKEAMGLEEL
jgi:hypothetical protein